MAGVVGTSGEEGVILGGNLKLGRRILAYVSILVVYFFYCYNWMVDIFVRPTLLNVYGFSLAQAEFIYSGLSWGTVVGTIIFGILATRIGKKRTFMIIGITYSAMTALPLIDPSNYVLWFVCRLLTGFALGGTFGTGISLSCELFKKKQRAKIAAICTSQFSLAMVFSGWLYAVLGDANWKVLILTAAIPGLIGVIMVLFFVPSDIENTKKLLDESGTGNTKINPLDMYKGKYLIIGLGAIFLSATNLVSYTLYTNNATTYLTQVLGMSAVVAGSIYSVQGIGQFIGYNLWGALSDKFGRRFPALGMLFTGVILFVFNGLGFLGNSNITIYYVLSFFTGLFFGYSGMWGAYFGELFPEKFKALGSGFSFNGGKIIMAVANPLITFIVVGVFARIFNAAAIIMIIGTVIWFLLPETLEKENKSK